MSESFKALLLTQEDGGVHSQIRDVSMDDLPAGDVLVAVEYSDLNYKDAEKHLQRSLASCTTAPV